MPSVYEDLLGQTAEPVAPPPVAAPPQNSTVFQDLLGETAPAPATPAPPPQPSAFHDLLGLAKSAGKSVLPGIQEFIDDTTHAIPDFISGNVHDIGAIAEISKKSGLKTALRAYGRDMLNQARADLGLPPSEGQEDQALAQSLALYRQEFGDSKKLNELLVSTFGGGMSKEEQKSMERGLVNLSFMVPVAGTPEAAIRGATNKLAAPIIRNKLRAIVQAEMHSIASFTAWNAAHAAINETDMKKAVEEGLIGGAVAPVLGKATGAVLGGGTRLAGKVAGATIKPAAQALDRALSHIEDYRGARNFLQHAYDEGWFIAGHSGEGLLRAAGAGKTADMLKEVRSSGGTLGAAWDNTARVAFKGLNKKEANTLGAILGMPAEDALRLATGQGVKNPADLVARAAKINANNREVGSLAQSLGIPQVDPTSNEIRQFYMREGWDMPHVYVKTDKLAKPGKAREAAIEQLQTFYKKTRQEAEEILDQIHAQNEPELSTGRGVVNVNLQGRRYNLPGFVLDPRATLPHYYSDMAKRITQFAKFGPEAGAAMGKDLQSQYPKAFEEALQIQDPRRRELAIKIIEDQLGGMEKGSVAAQRFGRWLQYQAITKLGTAWINQTSQIAGGVVPHGFHDAAQDLVQVIARDPAVHDAVLRTGAASDVMARMAMAEVSGSGTATTMKAIKPMILMDTAARRYGALRGFSIASYQAEQLAKLLRGRGKFGKIENAYTEKQIAKIEKKFAELGIDASEVVSRGGVLTGEDFIKAGQKMSTDVNFWGDALSLPHFYRSPWGRVVTQFKPFMYQQAKFMQQYVVKPALNGDFAPLARALVAYEGAGEAINDLKALVRAKPRTDEGVIRAVNNLAGAGALAGVFDIAQATNFENGIYSLLGGPIAADVGDTWYGVSKATDGNGKYLAKKIVAAGVPYVGSKIPGVAPITTALTPALTNILFPPKEEQ